MPDQPADSTAPNSQAGNPRTSGIGPVLREQAGKLADRTKEAGVETAGAVGKAAERALRVDPRTCRARALQSSWTACTREFETNLVT